MVMLIDQLNAGSLKSSFGSISYQRGQEYFAAGRVSNVEIFQEDANNVIVCAAVQGQKSYDVNITLTRTTSKQGPNISGDCTCPMVYNCKHVVAVLFAVIEQQAPAPQPAPLKHDDPEVTRWLASLDNAVARLPAQSYQLPHHPLKKDTQSCPTLHHHAKTMTTWYTMDTAPKTRAIRLNLQDAFGPRHNFSFAPAKWCEEGQCWINAVKGTKIKPMAIGWAEIR